MAEPSTYTMGKGTSGIADDREKGPGSLTGYRTQCLPTSCMLQLKSQSAGPIDSTQGQASPITQLTGTMNQYVPTPKGQIHKG